MPSYFNFWSTLKGLGSIPYVCPCDFYQYGVYNSYGSNVEVLGVGCWVALMHLILLISLISLICSFGTRF